ncbi:MAG: hypothetical protein ACK57V_17710, partial [Pirellula sp.]
MLEACVRPKDLVKKAEEYKMSAVAITDNG